MNIFKESAFNCGSVMTYYYVMMFYSILERIARVFKRGHNNS